MRARIIAIGQRAAGDDAAGLVVLDRLRREKELESTRGSLHTAERGDDAVGLAAVDHLLRGAASAAGGLDRPRGHGGCGLRTGAWSAAELCEAADAAALIPLLRYLGPVILIDAFVGREPPGTVRELPFEAIATDGPAPVSSHAMSVRQAIDLAQTLYPEEVGPFLRIVGISIPRPEGHGAGLSPPVADAVSRAVAAIARILERCGGEDPREPREGHEAVEIVRPRIVKNGTLRMGRSIS